jgi:hypothetical protein
MTDSAFLAIFMTTRIGKIRDDKSGGQTSGNRTIDTPRGRASEESDSVKACYSFANPAAGTAGKALTGIQEEGEHPALENSSLL